MDLLTFIGYKYSSLAKEMKNWKQKIILFSFLVLPASSNYQLEGFSFGNAGGGNIGSSNYEVEADIGELSNQIGSSNYDLGAGLAFVRQASGPLIATFDNPGNFYNKLHFVIDNQGNPSDTKFALAISPDNFGTTFYVKSDHTVSSELTLDDYQTYAQWGETTGTTVIGLLASTTYSLKVKAIQGEFTETGWSPVKTAMTVAPLLSFDIDVAATDIPSSPPYTVNLGDLYPGDVITGSDKVWISLETNGTSGGSVFVYGQNAGLESISVGYSIPAVSGNLGALGSGFGIQGVGVTEASGGPLSLEVGYSGSGDTVGITDTLVRQIFVSQAPLTGGRASFIVKAKSDNETPAASDYAEILTVIGAANY